MTGDQPRLASRDDRQEYREARRYCKLSRSYVTQQSRYPGGYFHRCSIGANITQTIHDALGMVETMVDRGRRPECLVAGYMDAETCDCWPPMKAFTFARAIWSHTGSTTATGTEESATRITRPGTLSEAGTG